MKATHKQSCADCGHYFWYGEMVFHSKHGYRNFICQNCAEKETDVNEPTCGDCVFFRSTWLCDEHRFTKSKDDPVNNCSNFERKPMPNIKITAEVNGKQVPLETISAETFEAIKALEKPKEIPVARLATSSRTGEPRLLFKPVNNIKFDAGHLYALDLKHGLCSNQWLSVVDEIEVSTYYRNIQPL